MSTAPKIPTLGDRGHEPASDAVEPGSEPEKPSTNDKALLVAALAASGLSQTRFARELMGREPRTIRRWIKGQPIPKAAKQWLEQYISQEVKK